MRTIAVKANTERQAISKSVGKWYSLESLQGTTSEEKVSYSEATATSPWQVLAGSEDIKVVDENTKAIVLIILRKPSKILTDAKASIEFFGKQAKKMPSNNRGGAGGLFDEAMLRKTRPSFVVGRKSGIFAAYTLKSDGETSQTRLGNPAHSAILGWTSAKLRSNPNETNCCRLTALSLKHGAEIEAAAPFFNEISRLYSSYAPEHFDKQWRAIHSVRTNIKLGDSAFSTVTVNYNFRTGLHVDKGDFKEGLGVLYISIDQPNAGGEIVFPEYDLAARLEDGDCLLFDPHLWHATCPFNPTATRITFVCYLGDRLLINCR